MTCAHFIRVLLLACASMFMCAQAFTQGRPMPGSLSPIEHETETYWSKLDAAARARKVAELDVWLRRLPGTYSIDGKATQPLSVGGTGQSTGVKGVADCVLIGSGPGVQCMIKASWEDMYYANETRTPTLTNAYNNRQPWMMLFGLDPDMGGIQLMLVDEVTQELLGQNDGKAKTDQNCRRDDLACFEFLGESPCSAKLTHCWNRIYVTAKPQSSDITMILLRPPGRVDLRLRRVAPDSDPDKQKRR